VHPKATLAVLIGAVFVTCPGTYLSATAETSDACSLLTQPQVSAVLGVSVGAGQYLVASIPRTCGWSQPGDANHSGKRVVLDIFGPVGRLTPAERFNNGKTPVKGVTKTPVSGVGDDAYYVTTPGFGTGLNVKHGDSVFQIRVYGFSDDQIKALEKTLAQDALAKL
jgi:hypothetical protein